MVIALLALFSCAPEESLPPESSAADALTSREVLIRASLDLRGVRPTPEELDGVTPNNLDATLDGFLEDERFGKNVRDLFNYVWLTRVETYLALTEQFGQSDDPATYVASIGDEPLYMVSMIAEEDLPWATLVTADWIAANEVVADIYPIDYSGSGWQKATWTDGRPAVGVLASNALWWRYTSTASNANRGRANAISRLLLCSDYLSREVSFSRDLDLSDEAATLNATQNDPGCLACHNSLDPLASHLWGFTYLEEAASELRQYHAERSRWWSVYTGVAPEYYGVPTGGLKDLGPFIAADPRYAACAVETVFEGLSGREVSLADDFELQTHHEAFAVDTSLRSAYRSILRGEAYRSVEQKTLRPEQVVSAVEELTGYAFEFYGYGLFDTETYGLRTLSGGVDGVSVLKPAPLPTATMLLSHERLAEAAAWHVVLEEPDRLFTVTQPTARDDNAAEQMAWLRKRILSQQVTADSPDVEDDLQLWDEIFAIDPRPEAAWAGVISALIRDASFIRY